MICYKINGVTTVASSYQLSPRLVSPADIPWNKPFTPLRHSYNCRNLFIRAQGNVSPIPNGNFGSQMHLRNVAGPSAAINTPITFTPPNDMGFEQESGDGIGIVEFLAGKNYFVTGATGLLSKGTQIILGFLGWIFFGFFFFFSR